MEQFRHLLLLTLITVTISVKGQIHNSLFSTIDEVNITLGPNLATLYNDNITDDIRQPKVGVTAQIGLTYDLNNKFSLSANLLYERKGLKTKFQTSYYDPSKDTNNCMCTTSIGFSENNSNLDYLIFSALIGFEPSNTRLYFGAGPFVGHLFKARTKTTNLWDNSSYYTNGIDSFKRTDFGLTLSIGYTFKLNEKMHFRIQFSDNIGLINISNSSLKTTTNSFSASLGLTFNVNSSH